MIQVRHKRDSNVKPNVTKATNPFFNPLPSLANGICEPISKGPNDIMHVNLELGGPYG